MRGMGEVIRVGLGELRKKEGVMLDACGREERAGVGAGELGGARGSGGWKARGMLGGMLQAAQSEAMKQLHAAQVLLACMHASASLLVHLRLNNS